MDPDSRGSKTYGSGSVNLIRPIFVFHAKNTPNLLIGILTTVYIKDGVMLS
jgi:hypothetical protein